MGREGINRQASRPVVSVGRLVTEIGNMAFDETLYAAAPVWMQNVLMNVHGMRIHRHRYGGAYQRLLNQFDALARGSREALHQFQWQRLQQVLHHAATQSDFYRERFGSTGAGVPPIASLEDLATLPLLTKEEVRDALSRLLTSPTPKRGWLHGHTSGTTGSPLSLWYDRTTCHATNAGDRLQKRWAGIGDTEWVGLLLGRQVVPVKQQHPPYWRSNAVQRQVWFSSLHLSPATLPLYVDEIRRRSLQALEGYPSTLYVLARFLLDRNIRLPMRAVFSSSETLLDMQREAIEEAFQAPLFDFYGHAERAIFAIECAEHQGKHLVEPFGITEVVNAQGDPVADGEFGYLVGTSLFNTAMPMIRYRTGDISAIDRSPCRCGSVFPRIVNVSTKAEDIVVLPDGRWLSPSAITHPFKPFPEITESQVIQETVHTVRVNLVAGSAFTQSRESQLLAALQERLGDGVAVHIARVEQIPRERSGKFRWVISRVPHTLQLSWSAPQQAPHAASHDALAVHAHPVTR
jgi:phenylacetate-CoA ligase